MDKDIAISVKNVSKTFRIPHEKVSSIRGAFTSALNGKRTFEEFKALDDVSFEVKKGEFFGIIGRNGSGKSTLLKVLAGIYQADKGKVGIDGMISPFLELGIGFNPELSGRDNVYLNATVLGMTQKQIDEKFDAIVAFSELERFIDQKLKNYSSGMQVRLAFSVSIHANRDILLMDEVLAVGDSNFQSKCLTEFSRYKDMGKTVVLVTHDISTVQRYCDRAMLLRNGKIVKIGNPEEVGNAYIYENMSDEEKRLINEDNNPSEFAKHEQASEKKGLRKRKIAEITGVQFINSEGREKKVFKTGDDLSIRVYFNKNGPEEELNFGLAIFNEENDYILGINTFIDDVETTKFSERGYFEVCYEDIPLRANAYYVKAGIWGDTNSKQLDFLERSKTIRIFSEDRNEGLINLSHIWR